MVRSLYSGVAGMTAHQTKMDVIGNNIANVSTYGYKSSRTTFKDTYYQTTENASGATANSGGTNATQVGYGATVGGVDVNHGTSTLATTGYSLDVAIAGEGYLQVMDPDGNMYYTKAGALDIDAEGNLVDTNGNFVLGTTGSPIGQAAGSNKIKITLPYENSAVSSVTNTLNGKDVTVSASNETAAGDVSITFTSSNLNVGQPAEAVVTSSSIIVRFNSSQVFNSLEEVNQAINDAITEANGGVEHEAGNFSISFGDDSDITFPIEGSELVGTNYGINTGTVTVPDEFSTYFSVTKVGDGFTGTGQNVMSINIENDNGYTITYGDYSATLTAEQAASNGTVLLKRAGGASNDTITMTYPSLSRIQSNGLDNTQGIGTFTASESSKDLGLGLTAFNLTGGTSGGEQTLSTLTGIAINQDGVITGIHPTLGQLEIGRIDLAVFANPAGLVQSGSTYFQVSENSGPAELASPGTNGTGVLQVGALELSNVDLSNEFAEMITTQRGFQACARLITVSDTMLEELINLKR